MEEFLELNNALIYFKDLYMIKNWCLTNESKKNLEIYLLYFNAALLQIRENYIINDYTFLYEKIIKLLY